LTHASCGSGVFRWQPNQLCCIFALTDAQSKLKTAFSLDYCSKNKETTCTFPSIASKRQPTIMKDTAIHNEVQHAFDNTANQIERPDEDL
jgi:hypothetical protein